MSGNDFNLPQQPFLNNHFCLENNLKDKMVTGWRYAPLHPLDSVEMKRQEVRHFQMEKLRPKKDNK